jgi:hypothetical protein
MYDILLNSSQNEKCFIHTLLGKSTDILSSAAFFPKIVPFMRKCGKLWHSRTDENTAHVLHTLDRTTDIHSEYVILIAFPR